MTQRVRQSDVSESDRVTSEGQTGWRQRVRQSDVRGSDRGHLLGHVDDKLAIRQITVTVTFSVYAESVQNTYGLILRIASACLILEL